MTKLELMNQAFIEVRKSNDAIGKALFSTFKGAFENERKSSTKSDDLIIESLAKKFTENAILMKNEIEVEMLKQFMPKELEMKEYYSSINSVLENNAAKVQEYKSGKVQVIGFFMGSVMKDLKGRFPNYGINADIITATLKNNLNN